STRAATVAAILIAPVMLALPYPQSAGPTFEVATVKPYKDGAAGGVIMVGGGCRGSDSPTPGAAGAPGAGGGQTLTFTVGVGPGGPGGGAAPPPLPNGGRGFSPAPTPIGRCVFTRMNLKMLINSAYRLTALGGSLDSLLSGGPSWVNTDAF